LLADEPTGNLDNETGHKIMKLLHRICREDGTAVLMITHNEHWLEAYPAYEFRCAGGCLKVEKGSEGLSAQQSENPVAAPAAVVAENSAAAPATVFAENPVAAPATVVAENPAAVPAAVEAEHPAAAPVANSEASVAVNTAAVEAENPAAAVATEKTEDGDVQTVDC